MAHIRLPMAVCAVVAEVIGVGSHETLEIIFTTAGVPGPPPKLSHATKWKMWLAQAGRDPNVDSLAILGNLIEEFMDLPPLPGGPSALGLGGDPVAEYKAKRERLVRVLEEYGLRYFRGGRVLPINQALVEMNAPPLATAQADDPRKPASLDDLLRTIFRGLPRAMHPLTHRRKGAVLLSFTVEADIQDLLHSQLRPWISDIRPEEVTPSYGGSSTRMDFLLPKHKTVIETKRVRDGNHAKKIADELIIDIEHYRKHKECDHLWCVIYDPDHLITNPQGLMELEGKRVTPDGAVQVHMVIFSAG